MNLVYNYRVYQKKVANVCTFRRKTRRKGSSSWSLTQDRDNDRDREAEIGTGTETGKKWVSVSACITLGQGRIGQKKFSGGGWSQSDYSVCPHPLYIRAGRAG